MPKGIKDNRDSCSVMTVLVIFFSNPAYFNFG